MHHNQNGFTLPEILIGLAISSIIIAASFASYIVIKNNYDFQKDMKNISQTSRAVATMIMRDIRMAGYNYDDGPTKQKPEITNAIKITDGGTTAPDAIEIIYDKSYTERLKISYYTKTYNNRLRVYKKIEKCNAMNCALSSLQTVIAESPIADYVEDLQFTGYKNGNTLGTGSIIYGHGNKRWVNPQSITSSCGGDTGKLFDGKNTASTYWSCNTNNANTDALLTVKFDTHVRLEKIAMQTAAHLDGGTEGSRENVPFTDSVHPYGTSHHIQALGELYFNNSDATCAWSSSCSSFSQANFHFRCKGNTCLCDATSGSSGGCIMQKAPLPNIYQNAVKEVKIIIGPGRLCTYTGTGQRCNSQPHVSPLRELAEIQFYGEVFGEPQDPQELEIGLLIRSPEEHGTSPVSQTFNLGNRSVVTNDNYIRDSYTISALIRNSYYGT